MRVFFRLVGLVFALAVALVVGVLFYAQNANRLKPEIETLISEQTGTAIKLNGDLAWQLFPPLTLHIEDLTIMNDGGDIQAAQLGLKMDLSAMWQDVNLWKINMLTLRDTVWTSDGATAVVNKLELLDFQPGKPSKLFLDATYTSSDADPEGEAQPLAATLDGILTYTPPEAGQLQKVTLKEAKITTNNATGICQIDASENPKPTGTLPVAKDSDLIPIATLVAYNVMADCDFSEVHVGTETFNDAQATLTNLDRSLNVLIAAKEFLGGSMVTELDIDLRDNQLHWVIRPELENVDSKRLINWTQQNIDWVAPFAFNSTMEFSGNSEAELYQTIRGDSTFDGEQGQINITQLKAQLQQVALLAQKAESVQNWPDKWDYETFVGNWQIRGPDHSLQMQLDNMKVDMKGQMDYVNSTVNMLADVIISAPPEGSPFKVNPLLQDTPLPVRCSGPTSDVKCALDKGAAQTLISRALQKGGDSGLRRKIEQKIDEKVPEEYKDTARNLLDILGRALEGNK